MQVAAGAQRGAGGLVGRVLTPAVRVSGVVALSQTLEGGTGSTTVPRGGASEGLAYVGYERHTKFGRNVGEFNPLNKAVVRGVDPRSVMLKTYGKSSGMVRSKDHFAKLVDRRSGLCAHRDRMGTLHSVLSIQVHAFLLLLLLLPHALSTLNPLSPPRNWYDTHPHRLGTRGVPHSSPFHEHCEQCEL